MRHEAKMRRRLSLEFALAVLFAGSVLISDRIGTGPGNIAAGLLAVALPVLALSAWFFVCARNIAALRDFEKAVAVRAIAITSGVVLWVTTAWGLCSLHLGAPELPLALVAPLAAGIYSLIHAATARYFL